MSDDPPSPFRPGLLDGRSALVTGGGSGIGFEIARQLGLAGARVAVSGRRAPVLAAAVAALQKEGIDARGVQGDVRDFAACERMVAGAADPQTGALHILVK
jgi:peroxisomal 2,4-dienoyl-CoA reductase